MRLPAKFLPVPQLWLVESDVALKAGALAMNSRPLSHSNNYILVLHYGKLNLCVLHTSRAKQSKASH